LSTQETQRFEERELLFHSFITSDYINQIKTFSMIDKALAHNSFLIVKFLIGLFMIPTNQYAFGRIYAAN